MSPPNDNHKHNKQAHGERQGEAKCSLRKGHNPHPSAEPRANFREKPICFWYHIISPNPGSPHRFLCALFGRKTERRINLQTEKTSAKKTGPWNFLPCLKKTPRASMEKKKAERDSKVTLTLACRCGHASARAVGGVLVGTRLLLVFVVATLRYALVWLFGSDGQWTGSQRTAV